MGKIILLSLIFFKSQSIFALSLGQNDFDLYYGPNDPLISQDKNYIFNEEYQNEQYFNSRLENKFFSLHSFFKEDFYQGLICPLSVYNKYESYIQYINRLVALSYLFEAMREYERVNKKFGFKSCQFNWKDTFKECRPKSSDMKIFLKNGNTFVKDLKSPTVSFEESTKEKITEWLKGLESAKGNDFVQKRVKQTCSLGKCRSITSKKLSQKLANICEDEKKLFIQLCSEEDSFYGLSRIPEAYSLLINSNIMRVLNEDQENYGPGCLRNFIKNKTPHEKHSATLELIFSNLYQRFKSDSENQYVQGRLFPIGALREFQEKGLANLYLEEPKPKKPIVVVKKKPAPVVPMVVAPIPKKVVTKKIVKKKVAPKPKPKVEKIKESAFKIASKLRKSFDLEATDVDMNKFEYDFIFSPELVEQLEERLKKFSSQESLKEMKKFDRLGTKKAPLPLKFIKFLIDKDMHQGLYNITNIITDKFYVFNDIDPGKNTVELIQIKNDQSTSYQWQITILKPDTR